MTKLQLAYTLEGHEGRVWHASWSPDGQRIASCSEDKTIRVWVNNGTEYVCSAVLDDGQSRTIRCCEWSPDGNLIASASFDGTVVIWQSANRAWTQWDRISSLEGHDNEVKSVSWSYDGQYLATCGRDKKIWVWERLESNDFECAGILDGHSQDVKFVRWHPKLPILFSASYDDTIRVWAEDGGDWWCARTLSGHSSTVWSLSMDRLGTHLVSCSDDRSVNLWECESPVDPKRDWRNLSTLKEVHSYPVYTIDWNVEYNVVATGGGDNNINLLKYTKSSDGLGTLQIQHTEREAHGGDINCVRWNPIFGQSIGELLLSAADDELVKVWRLVLEE